MKKIFVALLTFFLGILAFTLFHLEKTPSQKYTSVQSTSPKSNPVINLIPSQKRFEAPLKKPFFDSFIEDEYYSGWFKADHKEDFELLWMIHLWHDSENSKSEKVVWGAKLVTFYDDIEHFRAVWIKMDKNRLSFKTGKIRGIEYKFEGEFLQNGNWFSEGVTVLKGTTQKFVKGRKVRELTTTFSYTVPECHL